MLRLLRRTPPRVIGFCLLLIVVASCDLLGSENEPSFKGKLVFVKTDSGSTYSRIYTMNIDGSELKRIASAGDSIRSPNGDHFTIYEEFSLLYPRWSPDGKKVVVELQAAIDAPVLMVMNADGSDKHTLVPHYGSAILPQWSPRGDEILYLRTVFGTAVAVGVIDTTGQRDRDVMSMLEERPQYIVSGSDTLWMYDAGRGNYQWGAGGGVFYGLVSINKNPNDVYVAGSNPHNEVFTFNPDTGEMLERLTSNELDEGGFKISPNGLYAAYKRGKYQQPATFFVLSLEDGSITQIPIGAPVGSGWNWSNDSKKIVFGKAADPDSDRNRNLCLYMVDVDQPEKTKKLTSFYAEHPDLFSPEL